MDEGRYDAELTALLDGELDAARAATLRQRLATDADLQARLALLESGGRGVRQAFDALLQNVPVEPLQARLSAAGEGLRRRSFFSWRPAAAAAAAALLFFAGGLADRVTSGLRSQPPLAITQNEPGPEDWRRAVLDYAKLYAPQTFAGENADAVGILKRVGAGVGVALDVERLNVPGLSEKGATLFFYDGTPLGQIAFIDAKGVPILFCIFAKPEALAATTATRRGEFTTASWSDADHSYMVIGRAAREEIAEYAKTLMARF